MRRSNIVKTFFLVMLLAGALSCAAPWAAGPPSPPTAEQAAAADAATAAAQQVLAALGTVAETAAVSAAAGSPWEETAKGAGIGTLVTALGGLLVSFLGARKSNESARNEHWTETEAQAREIAALKVELARAGAPATKA